MVPFRSHPLVICPNRILVFNLICFFSSHCMYILCHVSKATLLKLANKALYIKCAVPFRSGPVMSWPNIIAVFLV